MHALMIVCLCLPGVKMEAVNTEPVGINPPTTITIVVNLGRKKKDCKGFGICDIDIDVDWKPIPLGTNKVNGYISVVNGKVNIEFDRASMSQGVSNTYFPNGRFTLEENFALPPSVCNALGITGYTIKAGTYTALAVESANMSFLF